jgi:hypothetical protein
MHGIGSITKKNSSEIHSFYQRIKKVGADENYCSKKQPEIPIGNMALMFTNQKESEFVSPFSESLICLYVNIIVIYRYQHKNKNKEAKMQRKAIKKDRHFISTKKEKSTAPSKSVHEEKEHADFDTDLSIRPGYGFKEPQITIYSKAKTVLCQIFCFWK